MTNSIIQKQSKTLSGFFVQWQISYWDEQNQRNFIPLFRKRYDYLQFHGKCKNL